MLLTKVVAICSGGLDSTVMLYHILKREYDPIVVTFNYGQKHQAQEASALYRTVEKLKVPVHMLLLPKIIGSSLTGKGEIPKDNYSVETQKSTVVPNRNMIFIAHAVAVAIAEKAESVWYAAHANDKAVYPDCTEEFVRKMGRAIDEANYEKVWLEAPFIKFSKMKLVEKGYELGIDFTNTWSCYDPVLRSATNIHTWIVEAQEYLHCGVCGTCRERKRAFEMAGEDDPTRYAQ